LGAQHGGDRGGGLVVASGDVFGGQGQHGEGEGVRVWRRPWFTSSEMVEGAVEVEGAVGSTAG
jgi:hypothetical protein